MSRRRAAAALAAAASLAGCAPGAGDTGYAEIALNFVRTAGDVYRLNAAPVEELRGRGGAVLREPVGPMRLELERYGRLYLLCRFTVRRDRIVTVSVAPGAGGFQCDVKD